MYDCAIVGTGAAGVSAALTLKALKVNFVWLGSRALSEKVRSAEKIKNYPGLIGVSGREMCAVFKRQTEEEGIEITEGRVSGVYPTEGGYSLTCGNGSYDAKSVILATGAAAVKPIKGENEYLGRGVSYCATCDGFLYKDKVIAVFSESADDGAEIDLLAEYARTIYLFTLEKGVSYSAENVIKKDGLISEIRGDVRARSVVCGEGELAVDGVFMLRQSVAAETLVHGLKCEGGAVVVDRLCKTNLNGVFAAGDCTGRPYQYVKAAGEGNVCAHSVKAYLGSLRNNF